MQDSKISMNSAMDDDLDDKFKTTLISKNITVLGHRTSIRLEPEMWSSLRDIASREKCSIHDLCALVSIRKNSKTSLTAAIRVFIMLYFRAATTEDGHQKAGHGNFEYMKRRARVPEQVVSALSKMKRSNGSALDVASVS